MLTAKQTDRFGKAASKIINQRMEGFLPILVAHHGEMHCYITTSATRYFEVTLDSNHNLRLSNDPIRFPVDPFVSV